MMLLQQHIQVEVGTIPLRDGKVEHPHTRIADEYAPHRLATAVLDANFANGADDQSSQGSAASWRSKGGVQPVPM